MQINAHKFASLSSRQLDLFHVVAGKRLAEREEEEGERNTKRKGEQVNQPYVFYMCLMSGQSGGGLK